MKNIEIDDELYLHIVSKTQSIGESASSILRRLLNLDASTHQEDSLSNNDLKTAELEEVAEESPVDDTDINNTDAVDEIDNSSESVFNFINHNLNCICPIAFY